MSQAVLQKLLDRLYASLSHGPCVDCRPHSSRQRIDITALAALQHIAPDTLIPKLLEGGRVDVLGKTPFFKPAEKEEKLTPEQRLQKKASDAQTRLLTKLREIAEDARDYEQDTGENALFIGYPLISIPPAADVTRSFTSRVLGPLALIPIDLSVKRGASQSISIAAKGSGVDLVIANFPLLVWLEQQTGCNTAELFSDEEGGNPWREFAELAKLYAHSLHIDPVPEFAAETPLQIIPKSEGLPPKPAFLNSAVLGLFPVSNQGTLRDLKAMVQGEALTGPVTRFLSAGAAAKTPENPPPAEERSIARERLVTNADPCQARAVRYAATAPNLVIHGPPGTGKSQTITNIIGDHLARGERVLMVCDKRTALDVVFNRLEFLGLGHLCAIVHDPQRDQRNLYMKIREQLEALAERKSDSTAPTKLAALDAEIQQLHGELRQYFSALLEPPGPGVSTFHDLTAEWFSTPANDVRLGDVSIAGVTLEQFEAHRPAFTEVLNRAVEIHLPDNAWNEAAGISLADFLASPRDEFRTRLANIFIPAQELDRLPVSCIHIDSGDLQTFADRAETASKLLTDFETYSAEPRSRWIIRTHESLRAIKPEFDQIAAIHQQFSTAPLDRDLLLATRNNMPPFARVQSDIAALAAYEPIADSWTRIFKRGIVNGAKEAIAPLTLPLNRENAARARAFYEAYKLRFIVQDFIHQNLGIADRPLMADGELIAIFDQHRIVVEALIRIHEILPDGLRPSLQQIGAKSIPDVVAEYQKLAARARKLHIVLAALRNSRLIAEPWLEGREVEWRQHEPAAPIVEKLINQFETLESLLRLRVAKSSIPENLHGVLNDLIQQRAEPAAGLSALRRALLAHEISHRLRTNRFLQQIDAQRMDQLFLRYRELSATRQTTARDAILDRWLTQQKSRLVASTGTQLNSAGAALKRRLVTRGERALKLRQMILQGANSAEPDPLFDVCPVWMASPGTVAQIFPRAPLFDVVIFDEASQCRLEEAVPVLTRGKRVVIAGDPKQLPPTRFFEAAVSESELEEAESDQELFEQQQGDTEDLLEAALNTEVQQCYLDVHYRSRNESLIEFSNKNFYHDRLQAVPGHPSNRAKTPPIKLIRADGLYKDRANEKEAEIVCDIVAELLAQPEPPSIGVACFNLTQRQMILETIDERCEANSDFAAQIETARKRMGHGAFEGLFVKNLENVQGDERDHIIISTTFGPDASGKFRRNFGPLGQSGGARRLNVLVTRARDMIHVITSIPRIEYATLPEIESGQQPGGRWLLYAYLNFAESLRQLFTENPSPTPTTPQFTVNQTNGKTSKLALQLAQQLARDHSLPSDVPWGNRGFSVDIALRHPKDPTAITLGILCDMTRFEHAPDPVEWDIFRTQILETQGWTFHRLWTPNLFIDTARQKQAIVDSAQKFET